MKIKAPPPPRFPRDLDLDQYLTVLINQKIVGIHFKKVCTGADKGFFKGAGQQISVW